jgi:small subunit ribosomal protein S9
MANGNAQISAQSPVWGTGRRKTATVRVRVISGQGRLFVNSKTLDEFFGGHHRQKTSALAPLRVANRPLNEFDIFINAQGGGVTGQAESIRLGIARALIEIDPKLRPVMRKEGFLTRDPRMVERKKYGQPKARRRFQHSKR